MTAASSTRGGKELTVGAGKQKAGAATRDVRVQANGHAGAWGELGAEAPVEQLLEIWSEGLGDFREGQAPLPV